MFFSRFVTLAFLILLAGFSCSTFAQGFKQELEMPEKVTVSIKNLEGRVSVVASLEHVKKLTVDARSSGSAVALDDVKVDARGSKVSIDVRPRGEKNRIDLVVTIPERSKIEVEGLAGSVDVVGKVESATVKTDTGTIHADVPLDALKCVVKCGAAACIDLVKFFGQELPVSTEIGNDLDIVAEADDRDAVLRTSRAQEISRGLANEVHSFFDAAGNVQEQHEIEWFVRRRNVCYTPLDAIFPNRKVRLTHTANCASVTIKDAGIEAQELRSDGTHNLVRRNAVDERGLLLWWRKCLRIVAKQLWRNFANCFDELGVAATYDCAGRFGKRSFAQIGGRHFRVDVQQHHAALSAEIKHNGLFFFGIFLAEAA